MNPGMDLTFDVLATTRNEAAVGVLAMSLDSNDLQVRRRGIEAMLRRGDADGPMRVLRLWDRLCDEEVRTVQQHAAAMQPAVCEVLAQPIHHPLWPQALDALRMLNLSAVLPLIIDRAETCADRHLRGQMLATTIEMCTSLGMAARRDRGLPPHRREPVVRRLAESVRRYEFHRCEGLVEAFLAASRWGDAELRTLLKDGSEEAAVIAGPLVQSNLPAVVHLLAGFIRRRHLPLVVRRAVVARGDELFRDYLLAFVSERPSGTVLRNLRTLDELQCLAQWRTVVGKTPPAQHAALSHAYTANHHDLVRQLTVNLDILERGAPRADLAVSASLSRCAPLDTEKLLDAAMVVVDSQDPPHESEPLAQLLWRVMQLLDHPNPGIVERLRKLLQPLHAATFLGHAREAKDASYRKLGRLVRRIDPQAVDRIAEELRHPLLDRRLLGIEAAIVCDALEPLEPLLLYAAIHDHREARLRIAGALARGTSRDSLEMLRQLAAGPDGAIRDVASRSLQIRTGGTGAH